MKKKTKLTNKGIPDVCSNNILVLYDAYGFGVLADAKKALSNVDGYRWFHSVFWAASFTDRQNELYPEEPGRNGIFLYSQNEIWQEKSLINEDD